MKRPLDAQAVRQPQPENSGRVSADIRLLESCFNELAPNIYGLYGRLRGIRAQVLPMTVRPYKTRAVEDNPGLAKIEVGVSNEQMLAMFGMQMVAIPEEQRQWGDAFQIEKIPVGNDQSGTTSNTYAPIPAGWEKVKVETVDNYGERDEEAKRRGTPLPAETTWMHYDLVLRKRLDEHRTVYAGRRTDEDRRPTGSLALWIVDETMKEQGKVGPGHQNDLAESAWTHISMQLVTEYYGQHGIAPQLSYSSTDRQYVSSGWEGEHMKVVLSDLSEKTLAEHPTISSAQVWA